MTGNLMQILGSDYIDVVPTLEGEENVIEIGADKQVKSYYINLDVQNIGDKDLALRWIQEGMSKQVIVSKSSVLSQNIIIRSFDQPSAMSFSVYHNVLLLDNLVKVKGEDSFEVIPTLQGKKIVVQIGTKLKVVVQIGTKPNNAIWVKYKYFIIGGAALVFLIILCCCFSSCRKMKKKKKKAEKVKLKGAKPGKKLKRIQPGRIERKAMEELGSLKFVVRYELASEMLLVTIVEAEDVPVRDLSGYAYSFVVIKALPFHEQSVHEYKTRLVRAGFWPAFGDTLTFIVEADEIEKQVLYLYLYEMNRWTKQDGIGQVAVGLDGINLMTGKEQIMTRKLKPYDPLIGLEVETGAVFLTLEYDSEEWQLTVEVRQGDITPQDESQEKENSYVAIGLYNKDMELMEKQKTSTKKGTMQPEFGAELTFQIPDNMLPDVRLKVSLKGHRVVKTNSVIGSTIIMANSDYWKQLLDKGYTEGWFPVFKKPKKE